MKFILAALCLLVLFVPAQGQEKGKNSILIPESSQDDGSAPGEKARTHRQELIGRAGGLGPNGGMTPAQMWSFYLPLPDHDFAHPPATPAGGWGAIAIVDAYDYPTALNDFNVFSAQFGLPTEPSGDALSSSNNVFQVVYAGGRKPKSNGGWAEEAALDIEWAHAMSPGAKIYLVEALSNSFADLLTAVDVAKGLKDAKGVPIVRQISMSWGSSGEFAGETSYDSHFGGKGIVFFASSGDSGAGTSYPAVSASVVAVGGTRVETNTAGALTEEKGWSGSGGGTSTYVGKPPYQNNIKNTGAMRSIPDISANADPYTGVAVYCTTRYQGRIGWMVFGGTSVSAPCMAGMVNLSGVTYADSPAFLQAIYSSLGSSNFRDIVSGSNGPLPDNSCKAGWDSVTGVGSPQGTGF